MSRSQINIKVIFIVRQQMDIAIHSNSVCFPLADTEGWGLVRGASSL